MNVTDYVVQNALVEEQLRKDQKEMNYIYDWGLDEMKKFVVTRTSQEYADTLESGDLLKVVKQLLIIQQNDRKEFQEQLEFRLTKQN